MNYYERKEARTSKNIEVLGWVSLAWFLLYLGGHIGWFLLSHYSHATAYWLIGVF